MVFLMRKLIFVFSVTFTASLISFAQQDSTAAADSILLKQIEQQMQPVTQPPQTAAQPRSAISTNPNMSVIGDFQSSYHSMLDRHFDLNLNPAEFSFQSVVDPYARADFFLSLAKDPASGKYEADIEEAYLTTLELPADLQLKAGKFRMALGRLNTVHPHALPFIDLPNAYVNYFGDEGLNDEGLSLSWLVPNKKFYQELIVQATAGVSESPSFVRGENNRLVYLSHLKNFFTLSDN